MKGTEVQHLKGTEVRHLKGTEFYDMCGSPGLIDTELQGSAEVRPLRYGDPVLEVRSFNERRA